MERTSPDVQPLGGPDARRCAECKRVLAGRRADATWCSARCRMRWKRKKRSLEQAKSSYQAVHPETDLSLVELHERARPQHRADVEAGRDGDDPFDAAYGLGDLDDEPGIYSGRLPAPDPWQQRDEAFRDQVRLTEATGRIEADFERRARPYLAQQRRNPGVVRPELAELTRERDARIRELSGKFRLASKRHVAAHERQAEAAVSRAFAADLGRGRFLPADAGPAGRDVHSAWIW